MRRHLAGLPVGVANGSHPKGERLWGGAGSGEA